MFVTTVATEVSWFIKQNIVLTTMQHRIRMHIYVGEKHYMMPLQASTQQTQTINIRTMETKRKGIDVTRKVVLLSKNLLLL